MINKVYVKIKNIIKNNYISVLSFIFVLVCLTCPLPYYVYIGGGTINISDRIDITTKNKEKGSFNLAYVEELRATIPTYLLSYVFPDWSLEPIASYTASSTESSGDVFTRDKLYLDSANSSAIEVAYKLADKDFSIKNVYNNIVYMMDEAKTNLKVGDKIVKINGKKIKEIEEYKKIISEKELGEKINLTVLRGDKLVDCYIYVQMIDGEKMTGISVLTTYDYETNPKVNLKFKGSESGSSGGFTTSLAIYNRLTKKDITHGLKIVGTGTIDKDGDVGSIGGVTYKLKGAVKNKADIFFVPDGDNYEEAIKFKKKKKYKIKIVKVKNISDAIKYLENYN